MKTLISCLLVVLSFPAYAELRLLEAEKLELKYSKLNPNNRDPYVPEYTGRWRERASLQWRLSVLERLYWDNNIHTETIDSGTVKTVGWHWEFGLRIHPIFTPFFEHHSRHVMEEEPEHRFDAGNQFPNENAYGVRIRLIEEKRGKWVFGN